MLCLNKIRLCPSAIRVFKYQPSKRFLPGTSLRVWNTLPPCLGAGSVQCVSIVRSPNLKSSNVSCSTTPTWSPNLAAITWSRSLCPRKKRSRWHLSPRNQRRRWWRLWSQKRVCLLCHLTRTRRNPTRRRKTQPRRQRFHFTGWHSLYLCFLDKSPRSVLKSNIFFPPFSSAGLCEPYTRWCDLWD